MGFPGVPRGFSSEIRVQNEFQHQLVIRLMYYFGKTGINIITDLMGLLLAAIAVEIISGGLSKLLPGLGKG